MSDTSSSSGEHAARELHERFSVAEILNTVCHDLRASLSVTSGSASELASLEYGPLTDMQRQLVSIVQRGNGRLARLAGNLMFLSELWEGTSEPRPTRLDLRALALHILDELRRQDPGSRVQVELDLPDDPVFVSSDPERLRQVLMNLLGIALSVAHTRVRVEMHRRGDMIELAVEDDGPERKPHRNEGVKRVSSTELAVAVSQGLLELMGGTLTLQSPASEVGGCRSLMAVSAVAP